MMGEVIYPCTSWEGIPFTEGVVVVATRKKRTSCVGPRRRVTRCVVVHCTAHARVPSPPSAHSMLGAYFLQWYGPWSSNLSWLSTFAVRDSNVDRGLLFALCFVSGRICGCWLVQGRFPLHAVHMVCWLLSWLAQRAPKMVLVAMNAVQSFIADCSASSVSFLAGFGTNGWLWLEFYVDRSVWRSGYSHFTSKPRQKRSMWR